MNVKVLKNSLYGGFKSNELTVISASLGSGTSVVNTICENEVYYIMNEYQTVYPHPVYKSSPGDWKAAGTYFRLLMNADIAFILEDVGVRLIKNRNGEQKLITDEEELKKYRWDMLRAVEV